MTVKQIIEQYLRDNGFDGLAGDECGCMLRDLMPCECADFERCVPGRLSAGATGVLDATWLIPAMEARDANKTD
jgi:hypothetical protein